MTRVVLLSLVMFLAACNSQSSVPREVIAPDQMKKIVFDLLRADEYVSSYVFKDSSLDRKQETIKMYEQVFLIHKISKTEFYNSYRYYQEHPDKHKLMFDSLTNWSSRQRPPDSTNPPKLMQK